MEKISDWFYQDLEQTPSTNDAVVDFWLKTKAPSIVSAKIQINGRGRLGRKWQAANGNLYVSFIYQIRPEDLGQMVILSAVAVCRTIESFVKTVNVEIKWPNDVLLEAKKISGILFEKGPDDYWIMGIGINVQTTPDVKNALYPVTSLAAYGIKTNRLTVLKRLVQNFDELKKNYQEQGFDMIRNSWLDKAYNRGKKVVIKQLNKEIYGILDNLDGNGRLILKTDQGLQKIMAGDVFKA